jgi:Ca2+-transporting ATPase
MSERPRDPREPIIPPADLGWMVSESAVITLGAMASFLAARGRYGAGSQATTVAFNTLTTGQLLHAISCRSGAHSIYDADTLPRNPRLELALAGSLVVQAAANLLPALRSVLGMTPMGWADLLLVGAGSGIPLLVNEWLKRLRRAKMVPSDEAGADLQ